MGNSTVGNPWVLDTAATILAAGNPVVVEKMIWYPNAADDDLIVKDGNGNVKWVVRAAAGAPNKESYGAEVCAACPFDSDGFDLDTIDGGTLYVNITRYV